MSEDTIETIETPAAVAALTPQEEAIELWFQDWAQNLADRDVHNELYAAKEDLKARLKAL